MSKFPDSWYDENGKLKPNSQRWAEQKRAKQEAERIAAQVAALAEKPRTSDEQVRDGAKARIAEIEGKLQSGLLLPAERTKLKNRLAALKNGQADVDERIQETRRRERLAADPLVKCARALADGMERSWRAIYPGASEEQILKAISIARSNDLEPEALHREFKAIEESIAETSLAFLKQKAADKAHAALKANMESSQEAVAVAQGELQLAKVKGHVDEPTQN